jgi:hypothetical protein
MNPQRSHVPNDFPLMSPQAAQTLELSDWPRPLNHRVVGGEEAQLAEEHAGVVRA